MVVEVEHPTVGKVRLPGHAVKLQRTPATVRLPPPTHGQHTDEVLGEVLGLDAATIADLRRQGVVGVEEHDPDSV